MLTIQCHIVLSPSCTRSVLTTPYEDCREYDTEIMPRSTKVPKNAGLLNSLLAADTLYGRRTRRRAARRRRTRCGRTNSVGRIGRDGGALTHDDRTRRWPHVLLRITPHGWWTRSTHRGGRRRWIGHTRQRTEAHGLKLARIRHRHVRSHGRSCNKRRYHEHSQRCPSKRSHRQLSIPCREGFPRS